MHIAAPTECHLRFCFSAKVAAGSRSKRTRTAAAVWRPAPKVVDIVVLRRVRRIKRPPPAFGCGPGLNTRGARPEQQATAIGVPYGSPRRRIALGHDWTNFRVRAWFQCLIM